VLRGLQFGKGVVSLHQIGIGCHWIGDAGSGAAGVRVWPGHFDVAGLEFGHE
jgi:hypothetical protein